MKKVLNKLKSTEWLSVIIASFALFLSIYEGYQTRVHNELSVRPKVGIILSGQDSGIFSARIKNIGLGPAVLTDIKLRSEQGTVSMKNMKNSQAFFQDILLFMEDKENGTTDLKMTDNSTFKYNFTLGVGEEIKIFTLSDSNKSHFFEVSKKYLERKMRIEVFYEDFYGNGFRNQYN